MFENSINRSGLKIENEKISFRIHEYYESVESYAKVFEEMGNANVRHDPRHVNT